MDCPLCRGAEADPALDRVQVWEDDLWRLTLSLSAEVYGFSYLEPKRHITDITTLDGLEAATLGPVLSRVTRILREETRAEWVYIYVFGDSIAHLHLHLAPHQTNDALNDQMIRGELTVQKMENGAERVISKTFPSLPEAEHRRVADRVQSRLVQSATEEG